jgi:hypothetical protein
VAACPAADALNLESGLGRRRSVVQPGALAAAILILFLGIVGYARAAGHWHSDLPEALMFELIPRAAEFGHP